MKDTSKTNLCCGVVSKADDRMIVEGDIDILVSMIGITKSLTPYYDCAMNEQLTYVQRMLFTIGSEIAGSETKRISVEDVDKLNTKMEFIKENIELPDDFILPGINPLSAHIDMCRALCRTVERSIVRLYDNKKIDNEYLLKFINYLSGYLYLLARQTEHNNYDML
jgi:cob(I)alamin adenosyltransferase